MYKLYIFDLDNTLSLSKLPMEKDMGDLISKLLEKTKVAIVSGKSMQSFQDQFISGLNPSANFSNLLLLPTDGADIRKFENGEWVSLKSFPISSEDKKNIFEVFNNALLKLNLPTEGEYGEMIEDRNTQITYSALGQKAPLGIKATWDPDHKIREKIISEIKPSLEKFEVHSAGTTSIDITQKGIDKEFACKQALEILNVSPEEAIFTGDALYPGGNDEPATHVDRLNIKSVANPIETKKFLEEELK